MCLNARRQCLLVHRQTFRTTDMLIRMTLKLNTVHRLGFRKVTLHNEMLGLEG